MSSFQINLGSRGLRCTKACCNAASPRSSRNVSPSSHPALPLHYWGTDDDYIWISGWTYPLNVPRIKAVQNHHLHSDWFPINYNSVGQRAPNVWRKWRLAVWHQFYLISSLSHYWVNGWRILLFLPVVLGENQTEIHLPTILPVRDLRWGE